MVAILPADLTLCFERGTWKEQRLSHYDDDQSDSGHPIRSKRPGTPLTPYAGTVVIPRKLKAAWDAFYQKDCSEGAVPFYAPDLCNGGSQAVFWWSEAPDYSEFATQLRVVITLMRE